MAIDQVLSAKCSRRAFLQLGGMAASGAILAACGRPKEETTPDDQITIVMPSATSSPAASSTTGAANTQVQGVACRAGIVNDAFPGHCKHYVDLNGDGFCDLSEPGSGTVSPRS